MNDTASNGNRRRRQIRIAISTPILIAVLGAGMAAWNQVTLQAPMQEALEADSRNVGIEVRVHYKYYLMPGVVVYDLRQVSPDKAPVDVFRVFLQFADAMKGESFDRVELAFRGETKFILDGPAFHEIGNDFGEENPMYIVRTFPERLRTPDGDRAFARREGETLALVGTQMEDFSEFQRRWYIEDL
jgi:hypothetical protein